MLVEICANSVQSAINAAKGGAKRIELCQNLNEDGTTPSFGDIAFCAEHLPLKTMVLLRPRPGNFLYSESEYEVLKKDLEICRKLAVEGIVTGFLAENGNIDIRRTAEIVELAKPLEVTFHRAFDSCRNWREALEQIIDCGCKRLLTSGQHPTAAEGIEILAEIKQQAGNRIKVMAGSGINYKNAVSIVKATGVDEIHASCKLEKDGFMQSDTDLVRRLVVNVNDKLNDNWDF